MSTKPKILFLGTSDFAVPMLQALLDEDYDIAGVVTVPDRPIGRKKILAPSPVKILAQKHDLLVLQPEKLKSNGELIKQLQKLKLDLGVTVAYGKIIPQELLDLPRLGVINVHPSLLPKYRGPSPIQTALLNGDRETGVTIMQVDAQVDHGPILMTSHVMIMPSDNYLTLQSRLAKLGTELLIKILNIMIYRYIIMKKDWIKLKPQVQDEPQATFTRMIKTEDGEIKPSDTVEQALNKIRALNPEPGTFANLGIRVKILEAEGGHEEKYGWPSIKLQDGYLILKKIQPASRKVMSGDDWLRGQR